MWKTVLHQVVIEIENKIIFSVLFLTNLVITLVRALLCRHVLMQLDDIVTPFFLCLEKLHYLSFLDVETKESSLECFSSLSSALAATVFRFSLWQGGPPPPSLGWAVSQFSCNLTGLIWDEPGLEGEHPALSLFHSWDVSYVQEGASVWWVQLSETCILEYLWNHLCIKV